MGQNTHNEEGIPCETTGWNWGAFLLGPIWGIGNKVWISLLTLIPVVGLVMAFVLGAKGGKWAWNNKPWRDVDHFKKNQHNWALSGLGVWVGIIILGMVSPSSLETTSSALPAKTVNISDSASTKVETSVPKEEKKETPKPRKPVTLGAGEYLVGSDVPPGRYKATNIGRGTNFFVYKDNNRIKVNTILGDGIGSGDYTFWAEDGDKIKTEGKVKLIPV